MKSWAAPFLLWASLFSNISFADVNGLWTGDCKRNSTEYEDIDVSVIQESLSISIKLPFFPMPINYTGRKEKLEYWSTDNMRSMFERVNTWSEDQNSMESIGTLTYYFEFPGHSTERHFSTSFNYTRVGESLSIRLYETHLLENGPGLSGEVVCSLKRK